MTKIFIVAPANTVTGGPELLHQLGDALNRETRLAWMLYAPFDKSHETPAPYIRYNVGPARLDDIDRDSIVVLPEIYTKLIRRFPTPRIYFWWLSVDDFFHHAGFTAPLGPIGGRNLIAKSYIGQLRQHVERHLYQSEYAREFLVSQSLAPSSRVSDYLAEEYVKELAKPASTPRENLVVYNPKKGRRRTRQILRALRQSDGPMPEVVPLAGMTRSQVCELLGRAKLYIDFGGHPGKDRIPREAVALGACVLVNRRGSALNSVDIPIPDEFKIDDRTSGFAKVAADRIRLMMADFERQSPKFEAYRQKIAAEPADFLADVQSLFLTRS